ncbi:MAG: peptidoglycan editing factor PgeF, partial [Steroidobacteraceae bacterium]|nr:peptidoglycan editing factor PgeF [Steroidobacteraceae bacterium]
MRAAFTTRQGGVSEAPWDSFNLGLHVNDAPQNVAANRARLKSLLSLPSEPVWLSQVHGVDVFDLDKAGDLLAPPTADAAIAHERGSVCTIMVADCLPVLFASRDGSRIGAAHAGWRGLAAGVLEKTVAALGVPGPQLSAWLGPAIAREHFEVGDEVRAAFVAHDAAAESAFAENSRGKWQADIVALARRRLEAVGVMEVSGGQWCTYTD